MREWRLPQHLLSQTIELPQECKLMLDLTVERLDLSLESFRVLSELLTSGFNPLVEPRHEVLDITLERKESG